MLIFSCFYHFFNRLYSPGNHLKTIFTPVASFSRSISPFRFISTPFTPNITNFQDFAMLNPPHLAMCFLKNELQVRDRDPLTRVRQMWNDSPHLNNIKLNSHIWPSKPNFHFSASHIFTFDSLWLPLGRLLDFFAKWTSLSEQMCLKYCACAQNLASRYSPPLPPLPPLPALPPETVSGTAARTPPPHAPGARMT